MLVTANMIEQSIRDLPERWVSDRKLAGKLKARHLRGGKITRRDSKEGAGTVVYAMGFDELGNCVALCQDGHIRQFIN
ncbi:hypothetical protein L1267_17795 [Pseudoalteromonas sp. OFAV1]|uniref:hypothetical protein n=1 Tax=Pseudoalteromonas sp. OFAV1 TaxID=2908892 RepID=UPI001F420409|nr:hypothetical protein [Pseudoalteromonas sp. OFAV1]MCF2902225.1 hypothetical protein [Pseudoalteromonas sp. OFAV1]